MTPATKTEEIRCNISLEEFETLMDEQFPELSEDKRTEITTKVKRIITSRIGQNE